MIHYTCDMCGRPLGCDELRFVVELDVHPVFDAGTGVVDDPDIDHLEELSDLLSQAEDETEPEPADETSHQLRLDLCPTCSKRFVKNPLGRELAKEMDFSKN